LAFFGEAVEGYLYGVKKLLLEPPLLKRKLPSKKARRKFAFGLPGVVDPNKSGQAGFGFNPAPCPIHSRWAWRRMNPDRFGLSKANCIWLAEVLEVSTGSIFGWKPRRKLI